jgi:hypothetical protein
MALAIDQRDGNLERAGALGWNRTSDQEIRRLLLYPLSYEGEAPKSQGIV